MEHLSPFVDLLSHLSPTGPKCLFRTILYHVYFAIAYYANRQKVPTVIFYEKYFSFSYIICTFAHLLRFSPMTNENEGRQLCSIAKGRLYDALLRKDIAAMGLKRTETLQWLSTATGNKYELILSELKDSQQVVSRIDMLEKNRRIHLLAPEEEQGKSGISGIHGKTIAAFQKQEEIGFYFNDEVLRDWNIAIQRGTSEGQQLCQLAGSPDISFENLVFLPSPLASNNYIFGQIASGKVAERFAWLSLPDGKHIIPTDGTSEGAVCSLSSGTELHMWEVDNLKTPLQAARMTARIINQSQTKYCECLLKMIGKEGVVLSTDDFPRNEHGKICRIEVERTPQGVSFMEVPIIPTIADAIDALLSPVIRQNILS